jgi:MFS family permease
MSDDSLHPPSRQYAWYVVAVLTLANISGNIDQQILALLVRPIERDLGITDSQMSYLTGLAFAMFYILLGLPIARWSDRSNRRNIVAGGVGLWSVFTALGATARTYGQLFAMRVGVGVGEATLNAPGVSLIADYFPRERRGRAMSIYSLGIFLGSGAAYFIGGWVVGLLSIDGKWNVPIVGDIHPWQSVFLAVGLPGFLVAALLLTIREPRREAGRAMRLPYRVLWRYVGENRRTFVTHGLGFTMSALVNFGIAMWLATFLTRTYGFTEAQAGRVQGLLTMTVGVAGVIAGGWISDRFVRNGKVDGPLRVGIIGALGMLVAGTAYPLMPTATLAVVWLVAVNFFAALPWGAATAAAAEIVPGPLRAQGVALYFLVLGLLSRTLGPTSVAWLTDYVFRDAAVIRYSLAIVNVAGMTLAIAFFTGGLGAYRKTLESRDRWTASTLD